MSQAKRVNILNKQAPYNLLKKWKENNRNIDENIREQATYIEGSKNGLKYENTVQNVSTIR